MLSAYFQTQITCKCKYKQRHMHAWAHTNWSIFIIMSLAEITAQVSTHDNRRSAKTTEVLHRAMSTQGNPEGKEEMKCWGVKATYPSGLYGNNKQQK